MSPTTIRFLKVGMACLILGALLGTLLAVIAPRPGCSMHNPLTACTRDDPVGDTLHRYGSTLPRVAYASMLLLWGPRRRLSSEAAAQEQALKDAAKEGAAVIGFSSAFAAYGAFFIPKAFGSSIRLTGGPESALYGSLAFYVTCIVVTWWFYSRRNAKIPC